MAVKSSYKIPTSLDESYFNMEISLKSKKNGIGLKPLPVRVLLVWVAALVFMFFAAFSDKSPIYYIDFGTRMLFCVIWLVFVFIMTKTDATHQMRMELIPSMTNYLTKSNRQVITRKSASPSAFYGIVGIEGIDEKTGLVKYLDGTYGYWYSVVGSASILLFPDDRDMILLKVDDFYKKVQPDCEIVFVTTKEPQKVVRQQAHLVAQYNALGFSDPDIDKLYNEHYDALTNFVGKEFKSLHQYMILKGDTRESLSVINNTVLSECENSSLVFKECVPLYKKDIERVLKTIYAEGD